MIEMLLRLLIMAALLTLPFGLLAILSGKADGLIWLMLPFVLMLPILFVCVVIFGFFEKASVSLGLSANTVIPIVGGIIGGLVGFLASQGRTSTFWTKLEADRFEAMGSLAGIIIAGAIVGAAWRLTPKVIDYFGWSQ